MPSRMSGSSGGRSARHQSSRYVAVAAATLLLFGCAPRGTDADTPITLMTQDSVAEEMDTYTYTFAEMPAGDHYIKWFEPKADMAVVHHMLLFGCEGQVSPTLHTRSGGMFSAGGGEPRGAVCYNNGGGWARLGFCSITSRLHAVTFFVHLPLLHLLLFGCTFDLVCPPWWTPARRVARTRVATPSRDARSPSLYEKKKVIPCSRNPSDPSHCFFIFFIINKQLFNVVSTFRSTRSPDPERRQRTLHLRLGQERPAALPP